MSRVSLPPEIARIGEFPVLCAQKVSGRKWRVMGPNLTKAGG